jgi:hypothetical protein
MLKRLRRISVGILTWVISCAFIGGAIVFVASKQHRAAEEYEAAREKRCALSFPSSREAEQQDACKHERDNSQSYLSWWYILITWPEGITAWAIILTGFAIAWQAVATQQAANAGKTAAEAAKDAAIAARTSAEAVFAAERPWLVESIGQLGNSKHIWIVSMQNTGNTPAEISDGYSSRDFMYPDFNLPATPARHSFLLQRTLIVKEDTFEVYRIDTESVHDNAVERLNRDGESFFIFGDVRYWDTFTNEKDRVNPHVSEWCYVYNTLTREFTRAPCTYHGHS